MKSVFRDEEPNEKSILDSLLADAIGRNQQLDTFMGLLNSVEKNAVLALDGEWGSGKTMFVGQINFLNTFDMSKAPDLHLAEVEQFQENYITYYYNAWENDYHEDPLQSLLFSLINDLWGARERAGDRLVKLTKGLRNSVTKTLSVGLISPEDIDNAQSITDLVENITTASERKKEVDDIIKNYIDLRGKKLLFIIDELDRCKPTYGIKLLEVIKHYFTNDKIVFLMSTNNRQLAHTVKKVYGESFDGTGYLSKFYDLIFNLPKINKNEYIKYLGKSVDNSYWIDEIPFEVIKHLDLSMREIKRYYSSLKLIENYLSSEERFVHDIESFQLVKYIFIPLAYGLRIHSIEKYHNFVNGEGDKTLERFCENSDLPLLRIVNRNAHADQNAKSDAIKQVLKMYKKITTDFREEGDDYSITESKEHFERVVLLMNSTGKIDETNISNKSEI